MKKTYIISSVVALAILAAAAGITTTVLAADNTSVKDMVGGFFGRPHQELTDAQKAEMKTKMDAVKAALDAGSYTAWVAAETALDPNSPSLTKVTADNFSTFLQDYRDKETKMAEMKTKQDAIAAAVTAGDYNAWVIAEKAFNANSQLLTKLTADNFSQYVQARNLQKQADTILTQLGIDRGGDRGGHEHGMPGNFGPGGPHDQNANGTADNGTNANTSTN